MSCSLSEHQFYEASYKPKLSCLHSHTFRPFQSSLGRYSGRTCLQLYNAHSPANEILCGRHRASVKAPPKVPELILRSRFWHPEECPKGRHLPPPLPRRKIAQKGGAHAAPFLSFSPALSRI